MKRLHYAWLGVELWVMKLALRLVDAARRVLQADAGTATGSWACGGLLFVPETTCGTEPSILNIVGDVQLHLQPTPAPERTAPTARLVWAAPLNDGRHGVCTMLPHTFFVTRMSPSGWVVAYHYEIRRCGIATEDDAIMAAAEIALEEIAGDVQLIMERSQ